MTPLKQRGKIRRTHIYTKGEDQTDIYIYTKREDQTDIEHHDFTKTKGGSNGHIHILRGKIRRNIQILRGEIRRTYIYIYYKIEQQASTKTKGEDQTDTYIYQGRSSDGYIQCTYTKGEDQSDTYIYIYTIRLNSRTPLKQRGQIRQTQIYTKGEDQTDTYIYIL